MFARCQYIDGARYRYLFPGTLISITKFHFICFYNCLIYLYFGRLKVPQNNTYLFSKNRYLDGDLNCTMPTCTYIVIRQIPISRCRSLQCTKEVSTFLVFFFSKAFLVVMGVSLNILALIFSTSEDHQKIEPRTHSAYLDGPQIVFFFLLTA